jgi:hypothetical protein
MTREWAIPMGEQVTYDFERRISALLDYYLGHTDTFPGWAIERLSRDGEDRLARAVAQRILELRHLPETARPEARQDWIDYS